MIFFLITIVNIIIIELYFLLKISNNLSQYKIILLNFKRFLNEKNASDDKKQKDLLVMAFNIISTNIKIIFKILIIFFPILILKVLDIFFNTDITKKMFELNIIIFLILFSIMYLFIRLKIVKK